VNALEPISPELVLVDPELARAARARLPEIPPRAAPATPRAAPATVETDTSVVEPSPPALAEETRRQLPATPVREPRHTSLSRVLLLISVFVNIVFISLAVSDARVDQPSSTSSVPLRRAIPQEAPGVPPTTSRRASPQSRTKPANDGRADVTRETTGAVERKVLGVVVQSPAGKLPPALIDQQTGLAKNNLQAVCRRSGDPNTFLCIIRRAQHKPNEGLYLRYRQGRGGRGVFTWYPYRTG
jgi:hypothetical protein